VLFWQFNDCGAGHSWSAIDAAGRRKPLWEMVRRALSPRLLSIHVVEGAATLFFVNDTDEAWEGEVLAERIGSSTSLQRAAVLAEWRSHVRIGPRVAGAIVNLDARLGVPVGVHSGLLNARAIAASDGESFAAMQFVRGDERHQHSSLADSGILKA
jgi:beta-mannosidase